MNRQNLRQAGNVQLDLAFRERPLFDPSSDCPNADTLWSALQGQLNVLDRKKVIVHLASCPSCSEDWRIGKAISSDTTIHSSPTRSRFKKLGWGVGSTMVLMAAGIMLVVMPQPSDITPSGLHKDPTDHSKIRPVFRGTTPSPTFSISASDQTNQTKQAKQINQALSSYHFDARSGQFSWPSQPGADRYDLLINDLDFQLLDTIENLHQVTHRVRPSLSKQLRKISDFYWQVRTTYKDGREHLSPTLRNNSISFAPFSISTTPKESR